MSSQSERPPWLAEPSIRRVTARMQAMLLELGRQPLGFCIWSHFPVELRHSTNGPSRADVTAADAQRATTAQKNGEGGSAMKTKRTTIYVNDQEKASGFLNRLGRGAARELMAAALARPDPAGDAPRARRGSGSARAGSIGERRITCRRLGPSVRVEALARRKEAAMPVQVTTIMDPRAALSRSEEVLRNG